MAEMDADESFVILGTSPLPSLDVQQSPRSATLKLTQSVQESSIGNTLAASTFKEHSKDISGNLNLENICAEPDKNNIEEDSIRTDYFYDTSLAASFILGEIDANVLKNSVYSQFPSLCSLEARPDDIKKLQNIMIEYIELKNTLAKVNLTMKQFFERAERWKFDVEGCRTEIAILRNENRDLKQHLDTKINEVNIQENIRQADYDDIKHHMSEKTAQINNMRAEIQKLEQMQLASFEYIPKNESDSKETPDYISRSEHDRIVIGLESKVSELLAQNLDLKDVQAQYIDEINYLKVSLTAAEELIKQSRADIELLKAKDIEKCNIFATYETDRCKIKEELALLQQQLDVYANDFRMERTARESLAGEKDQLLQDLRALQRKNQDLIEDAQKHLDTIEKKRGNNAPDPCGVSQSSVDSLQPNTAFKANSQQRPIRALPSSSNVASSSKGFFCPICYKESNSLSILQQHVNICLKD